jgi:lipoate---protein ligase
MNDRQSPWVRHDWQGSASEFHEMSLPSGRALWWCSVSSPAVILGSTQQETDVDSEIASSLGLDVVRRRSGGGAVFVHPTESVWIDITIPRDDPLYVDDVSASMLWMGDVFVAALKPWANAETYRGVFDAGAYGRSVCFASTSPGEVFVNDHKLVGISQRRGRDGARLQSVLYRSWQPTAWVPSLTSIDVQEQISLLPVATITADAVDIVSAVFAALPA